MKDCAICILRLGIIVSGSGKSPLYSAFTDHVMLALLRALFPKPFRLGILGRSTETHVLQNFLD